MSLILEMRPENSNLLAGLKCAGEFPTRTAVAAVVIRGARADLATWCCHNFSVQCIIHQTASNMLECAATRFPFFVRPTPFIAEAKCLNLSNLPIPIPNFRHVFAVFGSVLLVLD
jgi:hypothetical protein